MKVLCVHSFAVHGTASMKAILSILGTRILPVPSLYLSGLSNMEGIIKAEVDFEGLFMSSLELARKRKENLLLYVGYLGNPTQAQVILEGIEAYRDIITAILVDPVSGDLGKLYVPEDVLASWPSLLEQADWAFPNFTELQWLSGLNPQASIDPDQFVKAFRDRFPHLSLVLTSLPSDKGMQVGVYQEDQESFFFHEKVPTYYGGTGDVFLSYFIKYAFFEGVPLAKGVEKAALKTLDIIKISAEQNSADLQIIPTS